MTETEPVTRPRPGRRTRWRTESGGGAPRKAAARPRSPAATLVVTTAATIVTIMNYTAPLVTVPSTVATLHTSVSAQSWLLNGTPLGLAALLLVAGSLADDHGRRKVFLLGTLTLGITTALGALATTTALFTAARIVQGAASAAVLTSSLGLLVQAYPPGAARVRATGIWGAGVTGGIALGPLLAGAMGPLAGHGGVAGADWRSGYLVLGLLALAVAASGLRVLTESRAPRPGRPDLLGALTLGGASAALLAALTLGRDGWLRTPVWALFAAALALGLVFRAVERRASAPMLDLSLLRQRRFVGATAGGLFTGLAVIGFFSYFPTLAQTALRLGTFGVALLSAAWSGTAFAVALLARRLPPALTPPLRLAAGFLLSTAGVLALWNGLSEGSTWPRLIPGLLLAGAGSGLLNAALPLLAVESVPPERAAMGSGANNTARYLGSSAGVALSIALATTAGGDTPAQALSAGLDRTVLVSAALSVAGAVTVLVLAGRREGRTA
ncbi:MFS transporter [Streptomyces sp. NPDC049954]|uniref:MFS transporter n=1 Tax=Streptomyces sp. NPDC049954 TaxID=3155779 RepID=UPI003448DCAB